MVEKKFFETPVCDVEKFDVADVITTSVEEPCADNFNTGRQ